MVDLSNMAPLMAAWVSDPWGKLRPPLSVEAAEMSAVLAQCTYRMDVDRWVQAGWRDVTIQVDGELTDGVDSGDGSARQRLTSAWKLFRVRQRMRGGHPLGEVVGAWRQRQKSDTGKAIVMIHPADLGRYVVAISFMGTGERMYDWVSNFRLTEESGTHKGFLQLTRQFEDNEGDIDFPDTARELGLERLTLRHVLEEAKNPNSRFTLWLCGHSQGAALMQVYAHHKIKEDGVLPRNLVGYGFAAPSVMSGLAVDDPSAYPLYLIQNSEDVVTRMGAQVHLGVQLIYPAGEMLRSQCYTWSNAPKAVENRRLVAGVLRHMTDTPSCLEVTMAYLNVLGSFAPEELVETLGRLAQRLPIRRLLNAADQRADKLLRAINRHLAAAYAEITGSPVSMERVAELQVDIAQIIAQMGLKAFTNAQMEWMQQCHRIGMDVSGKISPYLYIVREGIEELRPAVWHSGRPPKLIWAARSVGQCAYDAEQPELLNRRMLTPPRRSHRHPRYADPRVRRDTRHITPTLEAGTLNPGEKAIHIK